MEKMLTSPEVGRVSIFMKKEMVKGDKVSGKFGPMERRLALMVGVEVEKELERRTA